MADALDLPIGMTVLEKQVLLRMADCLPIPLATQSAMSYSLGLSRSQQYIPQEPLLAPFNWPERSLGNVTDWRI